MTPDPTTDETRDAAIRKHWDDWLDHGCRCGFPHPKPGKHGPPPELVQVDGVSYRFPPYPGVMGGHEPVPVGTPHPKSHV